MTLPALSVPLEARQRVTTYTSTAEMREPVEEWQILSPVRGMPHGVAAMNRLIHQHYRQDTLTFASRDRYRKIPRPMGAEGIVYGDKVICSRNHRRKYVWPEEEAMQYIANGEVGLVVGQFRTQEDEDCSE